MKKQSKYTDITEHIPDPGEEYKVLIESGDITDYRTMQAWDIENFLCPKCNKKNISIMALRTKNYKGDSIVKIKIMCRTCLNQVSINYDRLEGDK